MTLKELDDMVSYMLITYPFVYESKVTLSASNSNIYQLATQMYPKYSAMFNKHDLKTVFGYTLKIIAKNNLVNGSIF